MNSSEGGGGGLKSSKGKTANAKSAGDKALRLKAAQGLKMSKQPTKVMTDSDESGYTQMVGQAYESVKEHHRELVSGEREPIKHRDPLEDFEDGEEGAGNCCHEVSLGFNFNLPELSGGKFGPENHNPGLSEQEETECAAVHTPDEIFESCDEEEGDCKDANLEDNDFSQIAEETCDEKLLMETPQGDVKKDCEEKRRVASLVTLVSDQMELSDSINEGSSPTVTIFAAPGDSSATQMVKLFVHSMLGDFYSDSVENDSGIFNVPQPEMMNFSGDSDFCERFPSTLEMKSLEEAGSCPLKPKEEAQTPKLEVFFEQEGEINEEKPAEEMEIEGQEPKIEEPEIAREEVVCSSAAPDLTFISIPSLPEEDLIDKEEIPAQDACSEKLESKNIQVAVEVPKISQADIFPAKTGSKSCSSDGGSSGRKSSTSDDMKSAGSCKKATPKPRSKLPVKTPLRTSTPVSSAPPKVANRPPTPRPGCQPQTLPKSTCNKKLAEVNPKVVCGRKESSVKSEGGAKGALSNKKVAWKDETIAKVEEEIKEPALTQTADLERGERSARVITPNPELVILSPPTEEKVAPKKLSFSGDLDDFEEVPAPAEEKGSFVGPKVLLGAAAVGGLLYAAYRNWDRVVDKAAPLARALSQKFDL